MKRNYLLPILFPLLLSLTILPGCSGDSSSPTRPPEPSETPLAEVSIGADGGVLTAEGFALTVPAGALDAATDLALYAEEPGTAFPGGEASPVFRIEGLPAHLTTALPLRLAHGSATGDSLYALIGGESYVPSLQETAVTWEVADCADSSGWARLELPAADPVPGKDASTAPLSVTIIRGVAETLTADDRFKIYWSPSMATNIQIAALKEDLEIAMGIYDSMGFQQEGFTAWPIKAIVKPMADFGYWAPNPDRLGGHLAFSTTWIGDASEIRLTAGHELLHFCQYFYDPRTVWERGSFAGPLVWLEEATAVYIEDYFAPNPEYCSAARGGRELALLDGLLVPGTGHTMGQHGYGVSSLIRYLAETEGDGFILDTFEGIKSGQHAVAALQASTTTDISDQWLDILEELVTGNIYSDVTLGVVLGYPAPVLLQIDSAADSVASNLMHFPDLSGQTYFVNYPHYEFNTNQRLQFWCDVPEYGLAVFGLTYPDTLQLLGHAYGPVTVGNLPFVKEHYGSLLLLVSNQHLAGPDYLGPSDITLQARLRETEAAPQYDHGQIRIRYEADWSNGSHVVYQDMNFTEVPGTFTGTSFSASWDSTATNGVHYSGHLSVVLDPGDLHALSWSARNYSWMDDGTSADFQASGTVLPVVTSTQSDLDTRIEGTETGGAIGGLSVTYVNSEGETYRTLDSWTCNSGSYVKVLLYNRDPD